MSAKEMLEEVQDLKEQVIMNGFEKPEGVNAFFEQYWLQILDILDDALYAYVNE